MERIGVVIKDNVVVNLVVWADHSEAQFLSEGFDKAEEVTNLEPRPGLNWTWSEAEGYRPPSPFSSWLWNGAKWDAPVKYPTDGGTYSWNEENQAWDPIPMPEPTQD